MDSDDRLWHITVTAAGPSREPAEIARALRNLASLRPFMHSLRHASDRAEIKFWEEAPSALDAASLALRVWGEFRAEIGLEDWDVSAFEIARRTQYLHRDREWPHEVEVGLSPFA